ncbi:hypothetical protein N665_0190s0036 [Sinapis alba]|nr:hypothetical protein N665_0190s0036 [Sinapis alba]
MAPTHQLHHHYCLLVDFKIRTPELDGKCIMLQIWVTAGHECLGTITTASYRGKWALLLVDDVTDESSFNSKYSIKTWIRNIKWHASDNVNKILVGNKPDMDESMRITVHASALMPIYNFLIHS